MLMIEKIAFAQTLFRNMSLQPPPKQQEEPATTSPDYYLSQLVIRYNQPGEYFIVKTPPLSTLFRHSSARELYDKVTKYVKEEIFNSAHSAPIVMSVDLSHDPETDRFNVYKFPNSLTESSYDLFKSDNPPSLPTLSHKEEPDNIIVVLLEHAPWMTPWGSILWWGKLLDDDDIDLVRRRKHYYSFPTIL